MLSVLLQCWLGGRKGIWPVKNWMVGCWHGYLTGEGADLHMVQKIPLPLTVSCFSKIQIGFNFLVSAHPDNPRQSPDGHKTDVCGGGGYVLISQKKTWTHLYNNLQKEAPSIQCIKRKCRLTEDKNLWDNHVIKDTYQIQQKHVIIQMLIY